ncbi:hypothetical protein PTH_2157 [Pelotomaculum thermopropionicum SI]|uniref:PD-(D/E)XK endonuclease-like domain-containing protein n=1 Tax=Pelotomaculum thermopropionicum (strain DSM 13744 / JCM 10971 / SI) TaxID=370438 RepID=A5D074_PELTS|nr:hypothetical protein PTH_2157 [Pelotomaculum thermopropionicum SI]
MGCLVNRSGARRLREEVQSQERGEVLTRAILRHFDDLHSLDLPLDFEIEKYMLEDGRLALENDTSRLNFEKIATFTPSSASKCRRELFFRACKVEPEPQAFFPFQRRWMRNGTAVHAAIQKDLLYAEKYLSNPKFKMARTDQGRPAWEKNIRQVKQFEHRGVKFQIYGMMDGVLLYVPDNSKIGLEFKTKSTTVSAVGTYKLKDAQESHRDQCTAYSLLFGLNEFLVVYESLAKDNWTKNEEARPDMRAFYVETGDYERGLLLDKFAEVAESYYNGEVPGGDPSKCIFCPYKTRCIKEAA